MNHVKVNYTNKDGKRTSTTINRNIAFFYYLSWKGNQENNTKGLPDDYNEQMKKQVQDFVNKLNGDRYLDKDSIEHGLLGELTDRAHNQYKNLIQ